MRSNRPTPIPAPTAEIVDDVRHNRVGVSIPRKLRTEEAGAGKALKTRESVVSVTVFFFQAPRAVLQTQPAAGIEPAVVARAAVEVAEKRPVGYDLVGRSDIGPERRRRNRGLLVRETGPPAFGSDIKERRIGAPNP